MSLATYYLRLARKTGNVEAVYNEVNNLYKIELDKQNEILDRLQPIDGDTLVLYAKHCGENTELIGLREAKEALQNELTRLWLDDNLL